MNREVWLLQMFNQPQFSLQLNEAGKVAHQMANDKGFYETANVGEKVALIHAEVSELLEELRKNVIEGSPKIPKFTKIEEELADVIIRTLDLATYLRANLGDAVLAKMEYNAKRPHKHGKLF